MAMRLGSLELAIPRWDKAAKNMEFLQAKEQPRKEWRTMIEKNLYDTRERGEDTLKKVSTLDHRSRQQGREFQHQLEGVAESVKLDHQKLSSRSEELCGMILLMKEMGSTMEVPLPSFSAKRQVQDLENFLYSCSINFSR